jgi:diguanylate cyclase (GGDEF)-like protein
MLREVAGTLRQTSPIPVFGLSVVLAAAIALVDHVTGYEISFSIFYLIPISVSAWYLGRTAGLTLSVLSAAAWLVVDLTAGHHYSNPLIPVWNGSVRLGFYVLVTSLLVLSKKNLIQVARLARIDSLTGVLNSGAFREVVTERIQLAARSGQAVVLAYIDIDDFKAINDTWGHAEGDRVLRAVAETLSRQVRKTDVVGRLGGDEFAMLFPSTGEGGAREVLDKIRAQLTRITSDAGWPIGFSIGAAVFVVPPKDPEEAITKADALMYRGKQSGKNKTVFLDSDLMSRSPSHDRREES